MSAVKVMPGASFWGTARFARDIVYLACWLTTMPFELLCHRRVGRRYHSTAFFLVAWMMSMIIAGLIHGLVGVSTIPLYQSRLTPTESLEALSSLVQNIPFLLFGWSSVAAFLVHCWCNRRRFGTPSQTHSFDAGVPTIVFPPFALRLLALLGLGEAKWMTKDIEHDQGGGLQEMMAYPSDSFFRNARINIRHHIEMLRNGLCPYGGFTWMTISWLEPMALAAIGAAIVFCFPVFSTFGFYLAFVALALRIKASIHASAWLEWAYDECDQRHELEAKRNWREGKVSNELSTTFVVPVARAVIPQPALRDDAGEGNEAPSSRPAGEKLWGPSPASGEASPAS